LEEIQNIIATRKGWWNAHKMARNWLRRFKKCKDLNLTVYFFINKSPINKENSIWERKVQNHMFMNSIKFY
jgi:hypothetical protein